MVGVHLVSVWSPLFSHWREVQWIEFIKRKKKEPIIELGGVSLAGLYSFFRAWNLAFRVIRRHKTIAALVGGGN